MPHFTRIPIDVGSTLWVNLGLVREVVQGKSRVTLYYDDGSTRSFCGESAEEIVRELYRMANRLSDREEVTDIELATRIDRLAARLTELEDRVAESARTESKSFWRRVGNGGGRRIH